MEIEVVEPGPASLHEYASVGIAFEVRSVFDCAPVDRGLGGIALSERRLGTPYLKDYDALEGEGPTRWVGRFDISRWGMFLARADHEVVGGAVVALDTPGVQMLEGRRDLAVLWDIRVRRSHRGRGIGTALFDTASSWAGSQGAHELKIETQNTNVPACRFYAARGCTLGSIDRFAYPSLPEEVQLLWLRALAPA